MTEQAKYIRVSHNDKTIEVIVVPLQPDAINYTYLRNKQVVLVEYPTKQIEFDLSGAISQKRLPAAKLYCLGMLSSMDLYDRRLDLLTFHEGELERTEIMQTRRPRYYSHSTELFYLQTPRVSFLTMLREQGITAQDVIIFN